MFVVIIHLYPLSYKLCLNKDLSYPLGCCLFSVAMKSCQQDGFVGKDACYQA